MTTVWGDELLGDHDKVPWPEYPRPGLVRGDPSWLPLNGWWDFAVTTLDYPDGLDGLPLNDEWDGQVDDPLKIHHFGATLACLSPLRTTSASFIPLLKKKKKSIWCNISAYDATLAHLTSSKAHLSRTCFLLRLFLVPFRRFGFRSPSSPCCRGFANRCRSPLNFRDAQWFCGTEESSTFLRASTFSRAPGAPCGERTFQVTDRMR
jgi:hypothetical protein